MAGKKEELSTRQVKAGNAGDPRAIRLIAGGSSNKVASKRQRKSYARQIHHVAAGSAPAPPEWSDVDITFSANDAEGIEFPHQDALVISAIIADFEVKRVLVDGGSSADILFAEAFDQMLIPRGRLTPAVTPLLGLGGRPLRALGQVQLLVTFGNSDANTRTQVITFDVVDLPYNYNAILGQGTMNAFDAVPHHNFLCLKMPGPEGIITV